MESIANIQPEIKLNWLTKRCRSLVFNALGKLDNDVIEVFEGNQVSRFGAVADDIISNQRHATIIINDASAYVDFVKGGSIGVAEAFIEDKWHSPNLTEVIRIFARAQQITDNIDSNKSLLSRLKARLFHRLNRNSLKGSKKNIVAHYDLGNELYTRFLDKSMMYSSAIYPQDNASLAEAQFHKLDTICQKLALTEHDHVIEIGTGWGGLAIHMAKHYGCKVTTTTISEEQFDYAQAEVKAQGLTDKITLLKDDYRDLTGQYDKLVSIEMIEAVGHEYLESFFQQCNALVKPQGKLLIQAITIADQRLDHYLNNVDFIQRYIFPGGFLPSITLLSEQLCQHTNMVMESLSDIGLDYAKTLAHWRENFLANWQEISQHGYDENFKRLWLYYFAYCEGAFLERATSTVHIVARKPNF
ncbi:SAM-dependent methyltransferase [Thalassotalea eurytherma]|uniref:Cyclopropane-fatty-acyl-phospholipid synthase n=1 Tax=Thalassotalea eurytherma TaxID=1144278 RepID=A0ABQ6H6J6_9GAMM|nr:cyclopropane-fatty-acyl-phospholipid synthase family protein [Thalassotalea eurytherma]GLX83579.1 cyclopropane-fatty-acyl-phospholipid synthase [Thalassotalea eurytherma]